MPRTQWMLTFVTLLAGTQTVTAGSGMLDLIPDDAVVAFAIRNPNELKKKGDAFIAETEIKLPARPSELIAQVYGFLGINTGLDPDGTAVILLANPKIRGADSVSRNLDVLNDLVAVVPFTDVDKMGANFGLKAGELKPDRVVKSEKGPQWFTRLTVRGNHLFLGGDDRVVAAVAKAKTVGAALTAAQRRQFGEADAVLFFGTKSWGDDWKNFLQSMESNLPKDGNETDRALSRQMMDSLESVRFVIGGLRIDHGIGLSLLANFPDGGNDAAKKFLTTLRAGPGAADLKGLPVGPVVAIEAARGEGTENAAVAKLFFNLMLKDVVQTRWFPTASERPNFVGALTEVWKRLRGNRMAIYQNADPQKLGLLSVVGILDTADGEQFLAEMKQLARYADAKALDLSDKTGRKDDVAAVEKLVADLGARQFSVRESATTKLSLIGEPVLPYLEKALQSADAEVRRRAADIKDAIVTAAVDRRKELLSQNLTKRVRPTFAFLPKPEMRDGQAIETVLVQLTGEDAAATTQFQELFGPNWNKIRLAVRGKQVIVLLGSDEQIFQAALTNVKEGRPGLAEAKFLAPFARHRDEARKLELHASLRTALALMHAEDLKKPNAAGREPALSSMALTVEADRLQVDWWVPSAELKVIAKEVGG